MDLNQLLYRRLSQDNLLNGTLAKYEDKPAIWKRPIHSVRCRNVPGILRSYQQCNS